MSFSQFDASGNHVFSSASNDQYDWLGRRRGQCGQRALTGSFVGTINFGGSDLVSFSDEIFRPVHASGVRGASVCSTAMIKDRSRSTAPETHRSRHIHGTVDFGGGDL
jgi:hypothetical protein